MNACCGEVLLRTLRALNEVYLTLCSPRVRMALVNIMLLVCLTLDAANRFKQFPFSLALPQSALPACRPVPNIPELLLSTISYDTNFIYSFLNYFINYFKDTRIFEVLRHVCAL